MGKFIDGISDDISKIHSEASVEQGITNQVTQAVSAQLAPVQDAIADLQTAVTEIVSNLTAGNVDAATTAATTLKTAVDAAATLVDAPDRSGTAGVTDEGSTDTQSPAVKADAGTA